MNTPRPTPETDAFAIKIKTPCGEKYWVPVDIARKLQRERDEWKALATQYSVEREHNAMQALAYEAERDEWKAKYIQQNNDLGCEQMDPNGTIWDHAATLQRERDELRRWTTVNGVIELERERDEARGQRDRLAEILGNMKTLAEITKQRDRMAAALEQLMSYQPRATVITTNERHVWSNAKDALQSLTQPTEP